MLWHFFFIKGANNSKVHMIFFLRLLSLHVFFLPAALRVTHPYLVGLRHLAVGQGFELCGGRGSHDAVGQRNSTNLID